MIGPMHYHGASPDPCYDTGGSCDRASRTCQCSRCAEGLPHKTRRDWSREAPDKKIIYKPVPPGGPKIRGWDDDAKTRNYWYYRALLINPPLTPWNIGQGIDQTTLANMLACVTLTHPDLGEGGDLAERNKDADRDAEQRLATARGEPQPVPAVRNSGRALHVTAVFMYIGALLCTAIAITLAFHQNLAGTLFWSGDLVAATICANVLNAKARKLEGH
jgi:hypothetical protein